MLNTIFLLSACVIGLVCSMLNYRRLWLKEREDGKNFLAERDDWQRKHQDMADLYDAASQCGHEARQELAQASERIAAYEKADSERIAAEEAKKARKELRPRTGTQAMREAEKKLARTS